MYIYTHMIYIYIEYTYINPVVCSKNKMKRNAKRRNGTPVSQYCQKPPKKEDLQKQPKYVWQWT